MTQDESNQARKGQCIAATLYYSFQKPVEKDKNYYFTKTKHKSQKFLTLRHPGILIIQLGVNEDHSFLRGSPEDVYWYQNFCKFSVISNQL